MRTARLKGSDKDRSSTRDLQQDQRTTTHLSDAADVLLMGAETYHLKTGFIA